MSVESAVARIRGKLAARVEERAKRGQEIALDLHLNAPRGGVNLNAWGEPRSAPNEPPAIEYGDLYDAMFEGLEVDKNAARASFVTNWTLLEYGTRTIAPRPMGRITATQLKQEASGGS